MTNAEKIEMTVTPPFVFYLQHILDFIKDNGEYMAKIDNVNMFYKGIKVDTTNGTREVYILEREIKQ